MLILKKSAFLMTLLLLVVRAVFSLDALLFNLGQLRRIQQNPATVSLLSTALHFAPYDSHIRWQTAAAAAESGDFDQSIKILEPLVDDSSKHSEAISLLLNLLVLRNHGTDAWMIYQKTEYPIPLLQPGVAAEFIRLYKEGLIEIPQTDFYPLLVRILGLNPDSPEIKQVFEQKFVDPILWTTNLGKKLLESISWRSQSSKVLSSAVSASVNLCKPIDIVFQQNFSTISLSENQILNGGFESYDALSDTPQQWKLQYASTGNPWNVGAFVIGVDDLNPLSGRRSLHIDGLLVEWRTERENARVNLIASPIVVEPNTMYVFCFTYRTSNTEDYIASFLPTENYNIFHQEDFFLPATYDASKIVMLILKSNNNSRLTITPLFRVWKEGSIWLDNFSVQKLTLNPDNNVTLPIYKINDLK